MIQTNFGSVCFLLSQAFFTHSFGLPGTVPRLAENQVKARAVSHIYANTSIISTIPSSSLAPSSVSLSAIDTSTLAPSGSLDVISTVVSGTIYSLTYVPTIATQETTIVESNSQTVESQIYSSGASIWVIPTLPPGFSVSPPPVASPTDGGRSGSGSGNGGGSGGGSGGRGGRGG